MERRHPERFQTSSELAVQLQQEFKLCPSLPNYASSSFHPTTGAELNLFLHARHELGKNVQVVAPFSGRNILPPVTGPRNWHRRAIDSVGLWFLLSHSKYRGARSGALYVVGLSHS